MDQVKSQNPQQEKKDAKPTQSGHESVESYQRRWAQLMEDTNKQLQKIREEEARKSNQTSGR
ncbi:hypothetical protein N7478_003558 [Penicillium angulare]|uniref:uncharacterized protein n=1 Tax=Penicillium angulare TaxID=116970 RepID=UPI0025402BEF|nr:uncharacterized protein N7478_003558 [Penicillium angulare]KAJ5287872.1 hypothetical protein N7478_003558 [Penicillium angulare]